MSHDPNELPRTLPRPKNDGACSHLPGTAIPTCKLEATDARWIDLGAMPGQTVVFAYPRTGRPKTAPLVAKWDEIPGARGCTPQTCCFRDSFDAFRECGVHVFGLSTQSTSYQREMSTRLRLPFPVLADPQLEIASRLRLPTFEVAGQRLIKRLAWYARDSVIEKVFYPVFPPQENAEAVIDWLRRREET